MPIRICEAGASHLERRARQADFAIEALQGRRIEQTRTWKAGGSYRDFGCAADELQHGPDFFEGRAQLEQGGHCLLTRALGGPIRCPWAQPRGCWRHS